MNRHLLLKAFSLIGAGLLGTLCFGWKPVTHAYLAQLALDEALNNNGQVTIYAVDYYNDHLILDSNGQPKKIGTYQCDPAILNAIRTNRHQFMAGVCGPDAYPDIATGQLLIHPAGGNGYGGQVNAYDVNPNGPGPDPWMTYLYNQAFKGGTYTTDANKSFVMGFFAHAAGDMFAHTYMNNYAGGEFNFHYQDPNGRTKLSGNALRHFIMEGYIAERTPEFANVDDYNVSLDNGVSDFIYNNMIKSDLPGPVRDTLLAGDDKNKSIPYMFSQLRKTLNDRITSYYKMNKAEQVAYSATHPLWITYEEGWRRDIDEGLKAFPDFSRQLSQKLFFYPRSQNFDGDATKQVMEDYYSSHLRYMLGEPHWVAAATDLVSSIKDFIFKNLGITWIEAELSALKGAIEDYICNAAFGMSYDDCKRYLTDPTNNFDAILNSNKINTDNGVNIDRGAMDRQLHLQPGGKFGYLDVNQFPAAYNTVTMIKLMMLPQSELQRLLTDLNGGTGEQLSIPSNTAIQDNVLLGYIKSLDAANQWKSNAPRMLLARNEAFYRSIFMSFPGEIPFTTVSVLTAVSNQANGNPSFSANFTMNQSDPNGAEVGIEATIAGTTTAVPLSAGFIEVPNGSTTGSFSGLLPGVTQPTDITITATAGNIATPVTLHVMPPSLTNMFVNTTKERSGGGASITLSQPKDLSIAMCLDACAPPGGAVVTLTSSDPNTLTVPATVTIAQGQPAMTFKPTFATGAGAGASANVTATYNGMSKTVNFSLGAAGSVTIQTQSLPAIYMQMPNFRPSCAQRIRSDITAAQVARSGFPSTGIIRG